MVVSVFVNPLQFGPGEDLDALSRDRSPQTSRSAPTRRCPWSGRPMSATMYPAGSPLVTRQRRPARRRSRGCRRARATSTACSLSWPSCVGQVAARRRSSWDARTPSSWCSSNRMVADLDLPVRVEGVATVRDADGLAVSSRNVYLSGADRLVARALGRCDARCVGGRAGRPGGRTRCRSRRARCRARARARLSASSSTPTPSLRQRRTPGVSCSSSLPGASGDASGRQRDGGVLMLLAVDVGNTQTVLGLYDGERLSRSWRVAHRCPGNGRRDDAHPAGAARATSHGSRGVAVCSSVPAVLRRAAPGLRALAPAREGRRRGARAPGPAYRSSTTTPRRSVPTGSSTPWRPTRCTAGLASSSTSERRRTSTWSAPNGEFLGGALAPGIEISVDALAARAARLRQGGDRASAVRHRQVNTVEALQSGFLYGFTGQVDGIVRRIVAELGGDGDSRHRHRRPRPSRSSPSRETITDHRPDLTLLGLRLVYERNAG